MNGLVSGILQQAAYPSTDRGLTDDEDPLSSLHVNETRGKRQPAEVSSFFGGS